MRNRMLSAAAGVSVTVLSLGAGVHASSSARNSAAPVGPRSGRWLPAGAVATGAATGTQGTQPAASESHPREGPPAFGVPIAVREIKADGRLPRAVLVNVGARDIYVFEVRVYRRQADGTWQYLGGTGQSGIVGWHPGEERSASISEWRPGDDSAIVPSFAFFGDGTAVGKPEAIGEARRVARASRLALDTLQQAFDAFPDPVGADQLQALIDQVALAFARVPSTPDGRGSHHFLNTMNELKQLASASRPHNTSVEDGVAQARKRLADWLMVERRLPVLLKDAEARTAVP